MNVKVSKVLLFQKIIKKHLLVIHIYKRIQFPHKNMIFLNMSRAELIFNINKEKESEREREIERKRKREREKVIFQVKFQNLTQRQF
jgi:hypothetical protein